MVNLDLNISLRMKVPDELDARLQVGEVAAFRELEQHLLAILNMRRMDNLVSKLEIQDAGPHNVIYNGVYEED